MLNMLFRVVGTLRAIDYIREKQRKGKTMSDQKTAIKLAKDLRAGDQIFFFGGYLATITYVRKSRRYQGFYAVQYEKNGYISEENFKYNDAVKVVNP